jgi:hypothetical protein
MTPAPVSFRHASNLSNQDGTFVKRIIVACLSVALASAALAQEVASEEPKMPPAPKLSEKAEKFLTDSLPVCSADATFTRGGFTHKLPPNMTGIVVRVDSKRSWCEGQFASVISAEGGFFTGLPWFLDSVSEVPTLEGKLKAFTWTAMKENFEPIVEKTKTRDGLYKATLWQTTEHGKLPLEGEIDPAGTVFFFGHFLPMTSDLRTARMKAIENYSVDMPTQGTAKADVTVVEFSDFECPSCQHAAGYMKPLLVKYGERLRYIRYDLPLTMHPWAFAAAMAGRAIWRQKPEAFWEYKEHVYGNQEKLTAFTFDDFARGFAQDHELDLKKYDADIASTELQTAMIRGVGTAFSNDIRSTPTYMVNGVQVDAGDNGKYLDTYIAKLLAK